MATGLFVPGPARIAIAFPSVGFGGTYQYLGTTNNGARSRSILHTGNVQNDVAGVDGMPFDMRLSGRTIVATMQVNDFDPGVMDLVQGRFFGGVGGIIQANEIGSLALTESLTLSVIIESPYAKTKTQYSAYYKGLRIFWAICNGELGMDYSTKEQTIDLTFFGLTRMNTSTLEGTCWDTNTSDFPA